MGKIHHGLDLGEATTFPLIVFSMPSHGANIEMSFCPKTPKLIESRNLKIGSPMILEAHNFVCTTSIEVKSKAKL
jgi:hypothetical protein